MYDGLPGRRERVGPWKRRRIRAQRKYDGLPRPSNAVRSLETSADSRSALNQIGAMSKWSARCRDFVAQSCQAGRTYLCTMAFRGRRMRGVSGTAARFVLTAESTRR